MRTPAYGTEEHCLQYSEETGSVVEGTIELQSTRLSCYPNYAVMISAVTGDKYSTGEMGLSRTDELNVALQAQGSSLTGVGYDYESLNGPSINFVVPSANGCQGGTSWGWTQITSSWNNRISSYDFGYTSCDHARLWDSAFYIGANIACGELPVNCRNGLQAMNNATTSLKAKP